MFVSCLSAIASANDDHFPRTRCSAAFTPAVFENREKMVLVMEFAAGGELYDYLSERKVLAEDEARRVFRQIATAVYYCHKHKICHRDLKLENILLDEYGSAKVSLDDSRMDIDDDRTIDGIRYKTRL